MTTEKLKKDITCYNGRLARTTTQASVTSCPPLEGGPKSTISRWGRKRCAFTLAEVLITLAVIGIVAVLTLPNLIQNHNQKAWSTAQDVFTKRLEVATCQMNTEEKLAGYDSTMDFVNELKKYIKITRICDNNELTKCFNSNILTADGQDVNLSKFEGGGKQFTKDNWGTETLGVQFANGVNALIAYNPNTTQDPYNNQFSATEASMAILYDVSGYKNPNTLGKDVNQNANVTDLGCQINPDFVGGMCIKQILGPQNGGYSPMTLDECNQAVSEGKLGITACSYRSDYWAGAVKACGGVQNMPTQAQLEQLAAYIYPDADEIKGGTTITNANWNADRASLFTAQSPGNYFYVWSGQEYRQDVAYRRYFGPTHTSWRNSSRGISDTLAVCLGD